MVCVIIPCASIEKFLLKNSCCLLEFCKILALPKALAPVLPLNSCSLSPVKIESAWLIKRSSNDGSLNFLASSICARANCFAASADNSNFPWSSFNCNSSWVICLINFSIWTLSSINNVLVPLPSPSATAVTPLLRAAATPFNFFNPSRVPSRSLPANS